MAKWSRDDKLLFWWENLKDQLAWRKRATIPNREDRTLELEILKEWDQVRESNGEVTNERE